MPVRFNDSQIAALIIEAKPLPSDYLSRMTTKPKRGHREQELDVVGAGSNEFQVILRQSLFNPLDFSVILAHKIPRSNEKFRLRRYNGRSHEHTNKIEGQKFFDFHIHMATERYQDIGAREDTYAEPTDRYSNILEAIDCLIADCGFEVPPRQQPPLFC